MKAVFLSASVPDPQRDARYHTTGDVVRIRDAVAALVEVVLPHGLLVWGGHPAIAPFVRRVAGGLHRTDRVETWQSDFFRGHIPPDTQALPDIRWTPASGGREASLQAMREQMLAAHRYAAGVFIGGMEGVEQEYELFTSALPGTPVFPVASTGGAARILLDDHKERIEHAELLRRELVYDLLFEDLILPLL